MEVEELGLPHPRHVWAGGGGLPAVGQDDAHQAREDHGCKRRGTVMLTSTKDTVNIPVKMYTMECTFESCTYDATDHWSGTKEDLLYILEEHVRTEHPMPTTELVEGHVTRKAWETFRDWWADYRDMSAYHEQVYGSEKDVRNFLSTFIGEAGGMVLQELGMDKFMVLTGAQMLKETERIAVQGGAVDKERRLYELPSGCQIPHFKSNELMGIKWAGFRQRLGEQKEQFSLTDRELVRLLWRACKPHPKIPQYIRETLGPGMRDRPMDKLCNMGSEWIMASMNRVAVAEREIIAAAIEKAKMVEKASHDVQMAVGKQEEMIKDPQELDANKGTVMKQQPPEESVSVIAVAAYPEQEAAEDKSEEDTVTRGSGTVSVYTIEDMSTGKTVGEISKQGELRGRLSSRGNLWGRSAQLTAAQLTAAQLTAAQLIAASRSQSRVL